MSNKEYRFSITLPDKQVIDHFFIKHPSESIQYFFCKIIIFALNYKSNLKERKEICQGENPLFYIKNGHRYNLWIEINLPSKKKVTHAIKNSDYIKLYCLKKIPQLSKLINESSNISAYFLSFPWEELKSDLKKTPIKWNIYVEGDKITINESFGTIQLINN